MPGLLARKDNGELRWYPIFQRAGQYTFLPSKEHGQPETGFKVGQGFKFEKYLPGYWMRPTDPSRKRRIGGGNSLVVLEKDGDLKFYPFVGNTFMVDGAGRRVGRGFKASWDYIVAEWTGNGTSDLLVRDDDGDLRLFPWDGTQFVELHGKEEVGEGFKREKYTHLLPGYWSGGRFPDLVVREKDGDLHLYPFDGTTFKHGQPRRIGRGFDEDYTHYFVDEWMGHGGPDLIVRHKNGDLIRYPFGRKLEQGLPVFDDPPYTKVGRGFKDNWLYIACHMRTPGRPDLIVCDDDERLRLYPFDGEKFVDLPDSQKFVGRGWKFTHIWDFYPE